jgi:hypothetical protein
VLDPSDTDLDLHTWENFISGMTVALELAGHEVVLIENIDKTDPYDQHAWLDDDTKVEDYRDDLL